MNFRRFWPSVLLAFALIAACRNTPVSLMPTPEAFRSGEVEVFSSTPPWERSRIIPVIYATNRLPADHGGYSAEFDDHLRVGIAEIAVGDDPAATWSDLVAISTVEDRHATVPLRLQGTREYYSVPAPIDSESPPQQVLELLAELNRLVQESRDPDLLIFVHGANNTFYRSVAQAAQYRHFTGRHSVVLVFDWPSTGRIWRYDKDVRNANYSAPLLAELLKIISDRTSVRHINLLGYSLGSRVVSGGLYHLASAQHAEPPAAVKQRMRIGEVYYAAADISEALFVEQLRNYLPIVGRVSLAMNPNDSVLGWSSIVNRSARAGRPDPDALSDEQLNWLIEASHSPAFDLVSVDTAVAPYAAFEIHDYWYSNPRVSTDVLMQMLTHAEPAQRGLVLTESPRNFEVWSFPEDYQTRVVAAIRSLRDDLPPP